MKRMRSAALFLLAVLIMSAAAPANAEVTNPTGTGFLADQRIGRINVAERQSGLFW